MSTVFRKRVFSLPLFFTITAQALLRLPRLIMALINPSTSRRLREQVMLACTQVNDCRYCAWAHTHLALKNGVDIAAMKALLNSSGQAPVNDQQGIAILYAQHFAEQQGRTDRDAQARLETVFTPVQQREIHAYLYAIYFANLSGNTFDALLSRLRGQKASGSWLFTELLSSALSFPVLLAIWWVARKDRNIRLDAL